MAPGVLAGNVDIELVVGMLDDGDPQARRAQMRDHARQKGGLPRAAPSRKPDHFHRILRALPGTEG